MKIKSAKFFSSFANAADFPPLDLPEVAFIGRSNVGKSSLVNLLCNQKNLALVSSTPGKTATINVYAINETWALVDLPGYGYAKTGKATREKFADLISDYLLQREGLRHIFVLIDSRHTPQRIDLEFVSWLVEIGRPFSLVFTKADKTKPTKRDENRDLFLFALADFTDGTPASYYTSSVTKLGRLELLNAIQEAIS